MNEEQLATMQAYALGYYHGRAQGVSNWCGEIYNDDDYVWYVEGYEKGVADYFEDVEDPTNNHYIFNPKAPRIAFAAPRSLEKATRHLPDCEEMENDVADRARALLERALEELIEQDLGLQSEFHIGGEWKSPKVIEEIRAYLAQPDVER